MGRRSSLDVADLTMLGVVLIWGANNVIAKSVLNDVAPLTYVFARVAVVVVVLLGWLGWRRQLAWPQRRDWPAIFLIGVTGFALYGVLFAVGLDFTTAFSVGLLGSLSPVFTLCLAAGLGIEQTRLGQWFGAALAIGGVIVFVGDKVLAGAPAWGDQITLRAALSFAIYNLAARPLVERYGTVATTFWGAASGLVIVTPVAAGAVVAQDWRALALADWGALLYAGLLSLTVAYSLWAWSIARSGVGRTVPYMFLVPVVSGILAAWWLDEQFGAVKLAGAALVLLGTAIVRLGSLPVGEQGATLDTSGGRRYRVNEETA